MGITVHVINVDAAGETDLAITDHDLAVCAEIDVAQAWSAQADGIKPAYLAASIAQRL